MNESALKVILELGPKYGVDLWKHVQWSSGFGHGCWYDCPNSDSICPDGGAEYRVKPSTHVVNGVECPAPMSELPAVDEDYFYVDPSGDPGINESYWSSDWIDQWRFKCGIFHTQEDALANFYAHYPHMRPEAE